MTDRNSDDHDIWDVPMIWFTVHQLWTIPIWRWGHEGEPGETWAKEQNDDVLNTFSNRLSDIQPRQVLAL